MVRIYPAFVGASLVCLFVVPLADATIEYGLSRILSYGFRIATLQRSMVESVFARQHYSTRLVALNGAMWIIQYEFFCYLLVVALGIACILVRPRVIILMAAFLLLLAELLPEGSASWLSYPQLFPGAPAALPGLAGMFLTGPAIYHFQDDIRFTWTRGTIALTCLAARWLRLC